MQGPQAPCRGQHQDRPDVPEGGPRADRAKEPQDHDQGPQDAFQAPGSAPMGSQGGRQMEVCHVPPSPGARTGPAGVARSWGLFRAHRAGEEGTTTPAGHRKAHQDCEPGAAQYARHRHLQGRILVLEVRLLCIQVRAGTGQGVLSQAPGQQEGPHRAHPEGASAEAGQAVATGAIAGRNLAGCGCGEGGGAPRPEARRGVHRDASGGSPSADLLQAPV